MRPECERIEPLLSGYVDGELAAPQVRAVETHLAGCPDCRGAIEQLRRLEGLYAGVKPAALAEERWERMLAAAMPAAPSVGRENVLTAGPRRIPMRIRQTKYPRWAGLAAGVLAAAGAVLVAVVVVFGRAGTSGNGNDAYRLAEDNTAQALSFENPSPQYETSVRLPRNRGDVLVIDLVRTGPESVEDGQPSYPTT